MVYGHGFKQVLNSFIFGPQLFFRFPKVFALSDAHINVFFLQKVTLQFFSVSDLKTVYFA